MKKQWWNDKICYQIYPKSFCDTNGDGIGDLPGIISKLDYLKDLGVDMIWISPMYASPLADQGYDISDYYDIDPRFGTLADMDRLLAEAHKRDMKILMDLVVNHCSDEHEWFRKACEDPEGRYGKFFYLEHTEHPEELCNWRSYFGGSVWEKLPGHEDYYYLHVFHRKQPDLNWENPELREEIYRMINWWLDRGLDGYRLDAIINIKKALPFRSYEADRDDNMVTCTRMLHDAEGIGGFLGEMRDRCFKPHNAFTVGEVFNEKDSELPDFIGDNGFFSSMFDFSATVFGESQLGLHDRRDITPDDYRNCIFAAQKRIEPVGFISNIIENHDEPRGVCRYIPEGEISADSKKVLATVYFLLRGLPWIYQGQEIGMENWKLDSIEQVDDISALDSYKVMLEAGVSEEEALRAVEKYSRDNARTPFQWDGTAQAGFTTGTPWLPVNPNYTELNLEAQKNDPASVFHHYRKLTRLRKSAEYRDTLVYGSFEPYLQDRHNVIAYFRKSDKQTMLVMANYQTEPQTLPLPGNVKKVALNTASEVKTVDKEITMQGYQAVVLELED
ncbi:MAG: alpha-glucosidase [Lachnospiraceae bacterium]|nr:alpha-glucosidase [Lachnospiraceae bacterium]